MPDGPERSGTGTAATEVLARDTETGVGCVLRVLEGDDAGLEHVLDQAQAVVGSKASCDLCLADASVSGTHFRVEVVPDGLLVVDLDSTNGTFYLETRLEKAVLPIGAVLRVGRTRVALASLHLASGPDYSERSSYGALIGSSPPMRRLYAVLEKLEPLDYTTLIVGETGVGKELVAQEIHAHSQRAKSSLEVCDCTSLSAQLIESELFGHERGAFTGAHTQYKGSFERADGSTLFLDEIGELPLELQPKLLRVLENRQFRRVGSENSLEVDVRVVAATNRDLTAEMAAGTFRQDLYYRLNLVTVPVPPLRSRREDIPALIHDILEAMGQSETQLSPTTIELFTTGYDWPGNVRELRNALASVTATGTLPDDLRSGSEGASRSGGPVDTDSSFREAKKRVVDAFEHDYLATQLAQADSNISKAARESGMERTQFKRLLRKHGLLSGPGDN